MSNYIRSALLLLIFIVVAVSSCTSFDSSLFIPSLLKRATGWTERCGPGSSFENCQVMESELTDEPSSSSKPSRARGKPHVSPSLPQGRGD